MASKRGDGNDAIVPVDSNSTEPMSPVTRADSAVPDTNLFGHLTLWQSVKKWRRVVLYCFAMTSAIMMYGFDYVIVGTVTAMPSFQRDFGERLEEGSDQFILPSLWLGLWNFISPGCAMVGAIAGGHFQDRYGRRSSLALGSLLCAAGVAVCFASEVPDVLQSRRIMFLAGKGFQGGAIGMVMATAQTYMSEILPPNLRGPLLAFFPMFTLLGQLIGAAVIFACLDLQRGYVVAFGTQWIFSAVPMVLAFLIPESPAFLVRKDRIEDAIKSQARLDCPGTDTRRVVEGIRVDIEHERRLASATYRDSFRKGNLRRTMIVMFANMVPQLFGLALLAKASYFVQIVGMKASLSVLVLILGILGGLIGNVASMWTLNKFGRRPLTITSLSAATVLWASMGVAGCFSGPATVWYTSAVMVAVIVICGMGAWPCAHVIGAETSALHLRAKAQGLGYFTAGFGAAAFGFFLPYIFNPDQGNLRAKTGFVYAGFCAVGVVITFFCVPEMKGRTTSEIDRMFELQLSARKFKSWTNPAAVGTKEEEQRPDSSVSPV